MSGSLVLLLALVALADAAVPDCQELVRTLVSEDPAQVFGKWVYVYGAGAPEPYHKALGSMQSSWIHLSPTSDSQRVALRWGDRCFNRCIFGNVNASVSSEAVTFRKNLSDHKGRLIHTCDNCLLWTDSFRNGDVTGRYILQFTRSGKMEPEDVEVFQKQVACLNFPENIHSSDQKTELCPDDMENTK
ncbi:uncharacterized protein ACB058_006409 [Synchiropus picturatus]